MANQTTNEASNIHGTNPQFLIEKIIRTRIYDSFYWKESCFALTAETIIDKAASLNSIGGQYGNQKPTEFLCLALKLLQLQPEKEIVRLYIQNEDYKYLRALGAFYLRLTGSTMEVYQYLEPLLLDFRKLRKRKMDGQFELTHMDEFVDELLTSDRVCDTILPRITKRHILERNGDLEMRISPLEDDLEEEEIIETDKEEEGEAKEETVDTEQKEARARSNSRYRDRSVERREKSPRRRSSVDRRRSRSRSRRRDRSLSYESRRRSRTPDRSSRRRSSRDMSYRRSRHRSRRRGSRSYSRSPSRSPSRHRSRSRSVERYRRRRDDSRDRKRSRSPRQRRNHDESRSDRRESRQESHVQRPSPSADANQNVSTETDTSKKAVISTKKVNSLFKQKGSQSRGDTDRPVRSSGGGGGQDSLSVEETNKMRAALGLKPLK